MVGPMRDIRFSLDDLVGYHERVERERQLMAIGKFVSEFETHRDQAFEPDLVISLTLGAGPIRISIPSGWCGA